MLKDSQFSHILILLILGYLIYYLTSPVEEKTTEPAEMNSEPTLTEPFTADHIESQSETEPEPSEQDNEVPEIVSEDASEMKPVEVASNLVEGSQEPNAFVDDEAPAMADLSPTELEVESETKDSSYVANDDSVEGASLDSAFKRNIPKGAETNVVDFNKNVLKNYDSAAYLPKEVNDKWFDTDFTQAKFKMNNDKLINTDKYVIGVDTVGQSKKNATYDLRGTIANPKYNVSPWMNSTYEPDYNIKPLC